MKFKKVTAGLYVTEDGEWEVQRDAQEYVRQADADGDGLLAGCQDDGWSLARNEQVIDWFDTKREAIAHAEQIIRRETQRG